jgi:hypothetical protein
MSEARRLGGLRAAEKRAQARSRFLDEVERVDPSLIHLARKLESRVVPYSPSNQSRVEWFLNYVETHPAAVFDAIEAALSEPVWEIPVTRFAVGERVLTLCDTSFPEAPTTHGATLGISRLIQNT